ncbi:hypothetical protein SK128_020771, partial [Halocaridina rubra]
MEISHSSFPTGVPLRYSITGGNRDGLFTIDQRTGVITLAAPLDYEVYDKHELVVSGEAGGQSVHTIVQVSVADVNDNPPYFINPDSHVTVIEEDDRHLPATLVKVEASDPDEADEGGLLYTITGDGVDGLGPEDAFFSINPRTGNLMQLRALDRDPPSGKRVWKLRVKVRDGQKALTIRQSLRNYKLKSEKSQDQTFSSSSSSFSTWRDESGFQNDEPTVWNTKKGITMKENSRYSGTFDGLAFFSEKLLSNYSRFEKLKMSQGWSKKKPKPLWLRNNSGYFDLVTESDKLFTAPNNRKYFLDGGQYTWPLKELNKDIGRFLLLDHTNEYVHSRGTWKFSRPLDRLSKRKREDKHDKEKMEMKITKKTYELSSLKSHHQMMRRKNFLHVNNRIRRRRNVPVDLLYNVQPSSRNMRDMKIPILMSPSHKTDSSIIRRIYSTNFHKFTQQSGLTKMENAINKRTDNKDYTNIICWNKCADYQLKNKYLSKGSLNLRETIPVNKNSFSHYQGGGFLHLLATMNSTKNQIKDKKINSDVIYFMPYSDDKQKSLNFSDSADGYLIPNINQGPSRMSHTFTTSEQNLNSEDVFKGPNIDKNGDLKINSNGTTKKHHRHRRNTHSHWKEDHSSENQEFQVSDDLNQDTEIASSASIKDINWLSRATRNSGLSVEGAAESSPEYPFDNFDIGDECQVMNRDLDGVGEDSNQAAAARESFHEVEMMVTVVVKDINDNAPVFPNTTMFGEIIENGPS